MAKRIYLTGQNNFGNRGCEALVRSTVALLRRQLGGDVKVRVPSNDIVRDSAQWPDSADCGVAFVPTPHEPWLYVQWNRLCRFVPGWLHLPWPKLRPSQALAEELAACDAVLIIGGDNYSLDYGLASLFFFVGIAEAALRLGKPVALWGASVGPFARLPAVERQMEAHLRRLNLISVRESHTRDYLQQLGVAENVLSVVDSAFLMVPQEISTSEFWPKAGTLGVVGLNVSPLIENVRSKGGDKGGIRREVTGFVKAAAAEGWSVLLIPHVAPLNGSPVNNDGEYLRELLAETGDCGGQVSIVPQGLNAPQLKYLISQCRFFIGARTHATIAALSTGVPTISISYSIKARGINHDLFGHERYVLNTATVSAGTLMESLQCLAREEDAIRKHLSERLPEWRHRAGLGAEALAAILSK
ncbi:MAG: polysaccharide pyruvyl transferase family protein [Proteobacteria bacterium]|nr:polysaccharide pyruvyl transferase family protein [Pseudomonadota bacterium]